ncbi:hypothetical protein GW17_00043744 [Ensete ventricosum]|nr:hypothetical protein GW17_00043744 [Ensete ventricosum]
MLRLGVTQEWVDEGELPRERTKNRRWRRLYEVLAEATHGEVMVRENRIGPSPATRWWRPCMRVAVCLSIDQGELLGGHSGVEAGGRKGRGSNDESSGAQLPKSKMSVRKEVARRSTTVPQRRIYRSRRKGYRCKAMDSRGMGLAAPWYCRGGTSVESSIPCSHGGRAVVVKGAEEVENAKANSKYQDRVEGQRPKNFIRPVSMNFSSREPKVRNLGLIQECSTKEQSRQYAVLYLFYSEE